MLVSVWLRSRFDGDANPALQSPATLVSDPYLIAHLRGAHEETLRVVRQIRPCSARRVAVDVGFIVVQFIVLRRLRRMRELTRRVGDRPRRCNCSSYSRTARFSFSRDFGLAAAAVRAQHLALDLGGGRAPASRCRASSACRRGLR